MVSVGKIRILGVFSLGDCLKYSLDLSAKSHVCMATFYCRLHSYWSGSAFIWKESVCYPFILKGKKRKATLVVGKQVQQRKQIIFGIWDPCPAIFRCPWGLILHLMNLYRNCFPVVHLVWNYQLDVIDVHSVISDFLVFGMCSMNVDQSSVWGEFACTVVLLCVFQKQFCFQFNSIRFLWLSK